MLAWLLILSVATHAAGDSKSYVRLNYDRGAGAEHCPAESSLQSRVAAQLGYDPFDSSADKTIGVRVTASEQALEAQIRVLEFGEITGERNLSSQQNDCAELSESMALAISIAIDPMSSMQVEEQEPKPAAREEPMAPPAKSQEEQSEPWQLKAGIGILGSVGTSPKATGGATVHLELQRSVFSLGVEGRVDLPTSVSVGDGHVSASLIGGAATGCWHHGIIGGCGVVLAGGLRGAGNNLDDARLVTTPVVGVGGRFQVSLPVGEILAVRGYLDALGSLVSTTLRVSGEDAWRSPPAFGSVGALLVARIY